MMGMKPGDRSYPGGLAWGRLITVRCLVMPVLEPSRY